ncbi:SHOCT domain-containing protein [Chitinophaga sp. RCC_12]|uniref:SHOCT domain-containing protein n=1 Tax=Chitinophaga sp. RCC_12 TaxID=3239226 RepID=UPI0035249000
MKRFLFALAALFPVAAFSQNSPTVIEPGTKQMAAQALVEKGYTTPSGWTVKPGDELKIGKGSMPNKTFSFIYQSPAGFATETSGDNYSNKRYAGTNMAGKSTKVKSLIAYGNKKTGYTIVARVGFGELVNYWIEIDNAVDGGELIPPAAYAKKEQGGTSTGGSVADELKKLKELLDSGALTQEEYNAQKKKLLAQ